MIMATCIIKLFRNGIFLQQTSRFGKIAEIMIQKNIILRIHLLALPNMTYGIAIIINE